MLERGQEDGGKTRHPGGRPTKLTPELIEQIVLTIKVGNYIETAAAMAGISKVTLYRWMRNGARAGQGIQREFLNAVTKAMAEAEARDVAMIGRAAAEHWQASAWRLERKFPDRWGRRDRVTVQGDEDRPLPIVFVPAKPQEDEPEKGAGS